jgi:hypothetical protein
MAERWRCDKQCGLRERVTELQVVPVLQKQHFSKNAFTLSISLAGQEGHNQLRNLMVSICCRLTCPVILVKLNSCRV